MLTPMPTQIEGAKFLADRQAALLADEPRVGKTGAAVIGADLIMAVRILVVTTASGRAVWRKAFQDWPKFPRSVSIGPSSCDVQIVSWAGVTQSEQRAALLRQTFDLLILDESHAAKNFEAARTRAVYGDPRTSGDEVAAATALRTRAAAVWCLSGTPLPNSAADLYPMMRSLCPDRLAARGELPDVRSHAAFMDRYVITRPKRISRFRSISVVVGGRNLDELKTRLDGFILRRTQADVGIRGPVYETLPLLVGKKAMDEAILAERDLDKRLILNAAATGDTKTLEMAMGPIRRLTGAVKAPAIVEAARDDLDNGLDKLVIMAWHTAVLDALQDGLRDYGALRVDGSTSAKDREIAQDWFRDRPEHRVFIGQIQACAEAIDLSAASTLWFGEVSFVPAMMGQASKRITNTQQTRQPIVRVCVLSGSIDEPIQAALLRKWADIRKVTS